MSNTKSKKSVRRELAIKKAKRNKIIIIIACVLAVAGIAAAMVFLVDWESWGTPPASSCGPGGHDPRDQNC